MALRNVTLTGTTIGSGISNVSIYHSFVDPNNLIQAGVTSTQLANGYTFQDQDYRYTYYVVSDSACGTQTRVVLPNAPISTFTEGQIVDISDNVITHDITAIGNTITNTQNDWMIFVGYGGQSAYVVRSDDNGQSWIKEPYGSFAPDRSMVIINNTNKTYQGGVPGAYCSSNYVRNGYGYFTEDGGSNWTKRDLLITGSASTSYHGGYIGYSFQDMQTRTTAEGTKRDGHNKYASVLAAQWESSGYFSTEYSYQDKLRISNWLSGSVGSGDTWTSYDSSKNLSGVSETLRGYGCRLTLEGGQVKIFAGASNGYMLKITGVDNFTSIPSGVSGTNQLITAVGHNQEELNEHGVNGSETTWLAAIEDPNQAANTQEFIMSTDDGDTWVSYTGTNMDTDYIYDIKYIKGRWYAVGKKGTEGRICSTADLNDPWEQMGTTKPCKTIGIGRDIENTKIIIGCEEGYIVQNQV